MLPFCPNDEGTKANLIARFGPTNVPGVVLSGHTDVVPANEDSWITPAFTADEREDPHLWAGLL